MHNPLINFLEQKRPMSATEVELISKAFEFRTITEGTFLFEAGQVCKTLYFVVKGILRIFGVNEKGVEVTRSFLKENQFCSILNSFYNQIPADDHIQAACEAEIFFISRSNLLKLYEAVPDLKGLIDGINRQSLMDKVAMRNKYQGEDSTNRYQLFLKLQPEIAQRVSMNNIASYLGITPQSLSRIRKNIR